MLIPSPRSQGLQDPFVFVAELRPREGKRLLGGSLLSGEGWGLVVPPVIESQPW